MPTETIPEALALHVADTLPQDAGKRLREQIERAYMAGVLEGLRRVKAGQSADVLFGEVLGWARSSIGREVSR